MSYVRAGRDTFYEKKKCVTIRAEYIVLMRYLLSLDDIFGLSLWMRRASSSFSNILIEKEFM